MEKKFDTLLERLDQILSLLQDVVHSPSRASSVTTESLVSALSSPELTPATGVRMSSPERISNTGTRIAVDDCPGCESLDCVKHWRVFEHIPKDIPKWLRDHHFVKKPACPLHGDEYMEVKDGTARCRRRIDGTTYYCRHVEHEFWPFITSRSFLTVDTVFRFWCHVASGESIDSIRRLLNLNKNTVTHLFDLVSSAAYRMQADCVAKFNKAAVDETYIGRRKYHRGKRPRKKGYWFASITEILRDGTCGRTCWKLVKKRDEVTLTRFVQEHLVGSRTVIWSDCHKGYKNLSDVCRHDCVNHSREFATEEGVHTNNAEGVHSVCKRWCLAQCHRFGLNSRIVRKNIALQTVKFADQSANHQEAWGLRTHALLTCVRQFYSQTPVELDTISSDTIVVDDQLLDDALSLPRSSATLQRMTHAGLADKRKKAAEPPTKRRRTELATEETVSASYEEAVASLRSHRFILSSVINAVMEEYVTRPYFYMNPEVVALRDQETKFVVPPSCTTLIIPVYYSYHWILAVAVKGERAMKCYDSLRDYAHVPRKAALKQVQRIIWQIWKQWKKPVMTACDQCEEGSNDCAVHCINNALHIMGVKKKFSRRTLMAWVVAKRESWPVQ